MDDNIDDLTQSMDKMMEDLDKITKEVDEMSIMMYCSDHSYEKSIDFLKKKWSPDYHDSVGKTPLMWACGSLYAPSNSDRYEIFTKFSSVNWPMDILELCKDNNCLEYVVNLKDKSGYKAITYACLADKEIEKEIVIKELVYAGTIVKYDNYMNQKQIDIIDSIKWSDKNHKKWCPSYRRAIQQTLFIARSDGCEHSGLSDLPIELLFMIFRKTV